jgi:hypothetical protein
VFSLLLPKVKGFTGAILGLVDNCWLINVVCWWYVFAFVGDDSSGIGLGAFFRKNCPFDDNGDARRVTC